LAELAEATRLGGVPRPEEGDLRCECLKRRFNLFAEWLAGRGKGLLLDHEVVNGI
jgi:hypothetical protein